MGARVRMFRPAEAVAFNNPGQMVSPGTITTGKFATLKGGGYKTGEDPIRQALNGQFRVIPTTEWMCGFSFQAPASGNITVEVGHLQTSASATALCYSAPEIRTGLVLGEGGPVYGAPTLGFANEAGVWGEGHNGWGVKVYNVTGLAAGADYNIRHRWRGIPPTFPVNPNDHQILQRYVFVKAA
jgi:hypothetical protein